MSLRFMFSAILLISLVTYADSAFQTDWSGGPGLPGPVVDWSNQFDLATYIEWSVFPGDVALQFLFTEITIDGEYTDPSSVYSEDIDGDGDMDVLGSSGNLSEITWWENIDGTGATWTEHTVDFFLGAHSVYAADVDGDGYMDVLGAAQGDDRITWWKNVDGSGISWIEYIIDSDFDSARSVYSEDIDGDGDMDALGAAHSAEDITWWENADGSGSSWTKHIINDNFDGAWSVYSEDINGDGDMDVLGASFNDDYLTWWENMDGSGTSWTERTIGPDSYTIHSIHSEDIDGDGDMDILGAAFYANDIIWWENANGTGTSWIEHTVDGDFAGARSVYSEDIDGDGDMDVLGAAQSDDDITWWENADGSGISWIKHTIDDNFDGARSVFSADINGDGDMDVLGGAWEDNDVSWWDVSDYSAEGSLESSILDTQLAPDWDYFEWNSQTPSGTSVSFQVRASIDHTTMGAWSDTLSIPCLLQGILTDGDQYVQYRVILETSNLDTTPVLFDLTLTWDPMGIEGGEDPEILSLLPFAPNPGSAPAVRFGLPGPASVELSIFELSGRLVDEIHGDGYASGFHDILLEELSPGIYFCRMTSGDFTVTQRFVVIE